MRLRCLIRGRPDRRLTPSAPSPHRIAVYLSAHGLGHAARASAVLEQLADLVPIRLTVVADCDRRIWPPRLAEVTGAWIPERCDVGVVQSDDVTVDLPATRLAVEEWMRRLPEIVARETGRLDGAQDLVFSDVPAAVFPAAKAAGIRCVGIANFSWDWIYGELGLHEAAATAAACYAAADLLLEAGPSAPMDAFPTRVPVGLVARAAPPVGASQRETLHLPAGARTIVLLAFQAASAPTITLPAPRPGRVFLVPTGWPSLPSRPDLVPLPATVRFEEALALADVVVGKPGYGLIGDIETTGCRFLYVPRPSFPENDVLERFLSCRKATLATSSQALASGGWEEPLTAVEALPAPTPTVADGAAVAARHIARLLTDGDDGGSGLP